jgi:hypothetical protein
MSDKITDPINNYADYLDSRDIEERIKELKVENKESKKAGELEMVRVYILAELEGLLKLKEQYVNDFGASNWECGAQFIRESYFKDYAQEFAEDCGLVKDNLQWPNNYIDWEQAARELAMDYSSFDFNGIDYLAQEA